jgi:hypothetical protein
VAPPKNSSGSGLSNKQVYEKVKAFFKNMVKQFFLVVKNYKISIIPFYFVFLQFFFSSLISLYSSLLLLSTHLPHDPMALFIWLIIRLIQLVFSAGTVFFSQKNQPTVFFSRLIISAERLHMSPFTRGGVRSPEASPPAFVHQRPLHPLSKSTCGWPEEARGPRRHAWQLIRGAGARTIGVSRAPVATRARARAMRGSSPEEPKHVRLAPGARARTRPLPRRPTPRSLRSSPMPTSSSLPALAFTCAASEAPLRAPRVKWTIAA